MSPRSTLIFATAAALAAGLAVSGPSLAAFDGGGSQDGDGYLNDAQKNPRYIEPYADQNPSRYRASNPREGFADRQRWYRADPRGSARPLTN